MRPQLLLKPLSLALLLAGCGPGVPDDAVLVTRTQHYLTPEGEVTRAEALDSVELLVPTDSGYTRLPVVEDETGRALLREVPEGPVLVRVGRTYVLTDKDERHVELGVYSAARPDAANTETELLPVQLRLSGLHPWNVEAAAEGRYELDVMDQLYVISPGTGSTLRFHATELSKGQTALEDPDASVYRAGTTLPQLSPERDSLVAAQLSLHRARTSTGTDVHYSSVRKATTVPAPTITGAEPSLSLDLALQDVPQRALRADLRGAAFASQATSVHPAATLEHQALSILPAAYGLAHGWVGEAGTLLTTGWQGLPVSDVALDLAYGNPFPASWGEVALYQARYTFPSGPSGGKSSAFLQIVDAAERFDGRAVTPVVSPPRSLTLDGQPAGQGRTLGSLTPMLAWEAPALGTPSHYEVRISVATYASLTVAVLRVPASVRQLLLPEGILQPGLAYRFRVSAYVAPSWKERPLDYPFPHASAEAVSNLMGAPGTAAGEP